MTTRGWGLRVRAGARRGRHRAGAAAAAGALLALAIVVPYLGAGASGARGPLAPATTTSVLPLCRSPLRHFADGSVAPIRCSPRSVNALAWDFYAPLGTAVMSLGRAPSWTVVVAAMCRDQATRHVTAVEEQRAAQLASLYNGWGWVTRLGRMTSRCG